MDEFFGGCFVLVGVFDGIVVGVFEDGFFVGDVVGFGGGNILVGVGDFCGGIYDMGWI